MTPADLTKHRRRCDPASVPMLCDEIERLEKRIAGDALEIKIRGEILDLINTILGTPMGLWHDMPGTLERKRDAAASNVSRWMEAAEIEHGRVLELQEQNARLRAALEPFANKAAMIDQRLSEAGYDPLPDSCLIEISLGDCRRAAGAIEKS